MTYHILKVSKPSPFGRKIEKCHDCYPDLQGALKYKFCCLLNDTVLNFPRSLGESQICIQN